MLGMRSVLGGSHAAASKNAASGNSASALAVSSTGPIVQRRSAAASGATSLPSVPGAVGALKSTGSRAEKPAARPTIDSVVSSGSQADFFKPEQTIILFDWDDTLCPSNWIRDNRPALSFFKPCPTDEKYQRPLQDLQKEVEATLKLAMKLGKVVIVTNAMDPWVETSCRNFLPQLVPIVMTLPIIYARSVYESASLDAAKRRNSSPKGGAMPGMFAANGQNKLAAYNARLQLQADELAPQRWKELAFEQELNGFYSRYQHQSWKNVISIGDSIFERDAVRRVVVNRQNAKKKCRTKTAKLLDEPDVGELVAQVRVIHDALTLMVQYDGNLDIEIDEEDLKLDLSLAEKIMDR